jgi:hypothetical protein
VSGSCDRRFPAKEKRFGMNGMVAIWPRVGRICKPDNRTVRTVFSGGYWIKYETKVVVYL